MKRLSVLATALAALTVLLTACGGGEEAGVLAVAFRLDDGSPVMSAYAGDPAKDPFSLPAGRYYIEAVDQDELVVSLGAVEVKPGETVELPASLEAAGGVADPERAEPLKTLANFLVDADLAEYAFLEIVTGGFELSPFDPAVQVEIADLEGLFGMYEDILAKKDGLLAAFRQIQARAQVSGGAPYVSSRSPNDGEELDQTYDRLLTLFQLLQAAPFGQRPADWKEQLRAAQEAEVALAKETQWIVTWNEDLYTGVRTPGLQLAKAPELVEKHKQWQEYAKGLVGDIEDEASAQRARERLTDKIASDLEAWAKEAPPEILDPVVDYFVKELLEPAGGPVGTQAPAVAGLTAWATPPPTLVVTPVFTPARTATAAAETPAATAEAMPTSGHDTGWVEGYVQGVADQWLAKGYGGIDVAVYADDLRQCLTGALQSGFSEDGAKAQCPSSQFEPIATPQPTETPAPKETETPTPEPTATPTPPPQDVTAVGQFLYAPPGETVVGNTASLRFNAGGGEVTLEGRIDTQGPESQYCDPYSHFLSLDCDGTYAPDSGAFAGTCQSQSGTTLYQPVFTGPDAWDCEPYSTGGSGSGPWQATLEGTVVKGSWGDLKFELTVQGG